MTQTCPTCGLNYRNFRTGLTYQTVYDMLWVGGDDTGQWRYKRRHTVLGLWHQIKCELWEAHVTGCQPETKLGIEPPETISY